MTPLAAMLARIGWTTGELARRVGVAESTTRSWASGRRACPQSVLFWVGAVARAVERVPGHVWETLTD
jgi:hypothetical protein